MVDQQLAANLVLAVDRLVPPQRTFAHAEAVGVTLGWYKTLAVPDADALSLSPCDCAECRSMANPLACSNAHESPVAAAGAARVRAAGRTGGQTLHNVLFAAQLLAAGRTRPASEYFSAYATGQ